MAIVEDIQSLDPGSRIELFELDLTQLSKNSADKYYFHAGTNSLGTDVVWQGNTYQRFPVDANGFEATTKGTLPRPNLRVSNVTGIMTALCAAYDDLIGAKVTRRRTLVRYLDAVNFPSRKNQLIHTNSLNYWSLSLSTVLPNATLAPDGNLTADKIQEVTTSGGHYVAQNSAGSPIAAGEIWTFSVYVKAAERTFAQIRFLASAGLAVTGYVNVDLLSGTAVTYSGLDSAPTIISVDNGWWRVSISILSSNAGLLTPAVLAMSSSTLNSYVGTVGYGIYAWGAQVEKSVKATALQTITASFSQNPTASPTQALPDDIYYVERKTHQDKNSIELELASAMDLMGQKLPNRIITTNVCSWEYRRRNLAGTGFDYPVFGCPYVGTNYYTVDGVLTVDPTQDICSKTMDSGCKKRYPNSTDVLPFGGFPGSKAYKF